MQGPKLRVGVFREDKVLLKEGQTFVLDMSPEPGDDKRVTLPHKEIFQALQPGDDLLVNDGYIVLHVESCNATSAVTKVKVGGYISSHKGVNLPNTHLPISAITEKDREDLKFALKLGVDWIGLSFVQSAEDVREAKQLIDGKAWLISKLENRVQLMNLTRLSGFPTQLWLPAAISAWNVRFKRFPFCKRKSFPPAVDMLVRLLWQLRCWNR